MAATVTAAVLPAPLSTLAPSTTTAPTPTRLSDPYDIVGTIGSYIWTTWDTKEGKVKSVTKARTVVILGETAPPGNLVVVPIQNVDAKSLAADFDAMERLEVRGCGSSSSEDGSDGTRIKSKNGYPLLYLTGDIELSTSPMYIRPALLHTVDTTRIRFTTLPLKITDRTTLRKCLGIECCASYHSSPRATITDSCARQLDRRRPFVTLSDSTVWLSFCRVGSQRMLLEVVSYQAESRSQTLLSHKPGGPLSMSHPNGYPTLGISVWPGLGRWWYDGSKLHGMALDFNRVRVVTDHDPTSQLKEITVVIGRPYVRVLDDLFRLLVLGLGTERKDIEEPKDDKTSDTIQSLALSVSSSTLASSSSSSSSVSCSSSTSSEAIVSSGPWSTEELNAMLEPDGFDPEPLPPVGLSLSLSLQFFLGGKKIVNQITWYTKKKTVPALLDRIYMFGGRIGCNVRTGWLRSNSGTIIIHR